MQDGFCTIPLSRAQGIDLIVRPAAVTAIFWADEQGMPIASPTPKQQNDPGTSVFHVAMLVPGCGDQPFCVDFESPEDARAYLLLHSQDRSEN